MSWIAPFPDGIHRAVIDHQRPETHGTRLRDDKAALGKTNARPIGG
jgi:hypothetical protein